LSIYPLELLFTKVLLALVPYFVLRGPVNRIARTFISGNRGTGMADSCFERPQDALCFSSVRCGVDK
jgi:hypothetical protein